MTMPHLILSVALLVAVLAAGCGCSGSSAGGAPKPLPSGRIPKGYGPKSK